MMEFTAEIKKATQPIYQKISKTIPEIEWSTHAPYIYEINKLKKEKNAVILAHNYQTPEIYHGISDFSADSLALAVEAAKTKADIIVMCGVHFMAETAKLMSPNKKVLLPDMRAGCSLSSSITGEDVRKLKKQNPGVPVVSYVNTSADVKAETDVCCTSANAVKIVNSLVSKKLFSCQMIILLNMWLLKLMLKLSLGKEHVKCMKSLMIQKLMKLEKIILE